MKVSFPEKVKIKHSATTFFPSRPTQSDQNIYNFAKEKKRKREEFGYNDTLQKKITSVIIS